MQSDTEWGSNLFGTFFICTILFYKAHIFLYSISDLVNKVLPCWLSHCFCIFSFAKSIVVIEERTEL